jgi:rare lipoprotein A
MFHHVILRDRHEHFFAIFRRLLPFTQNETDEKGSTLAKIIRTAAVAATVIMSAVIGSEAAYAKSGCGGASWYALSSKTASGERMNAAKLTAAHKSLRFGTKLRVTNNRNGKSVIVRINDRGPFIRGRVLDLSKAAASQIGMIRSGHTKVCYQVVSS